jgi:hypothetical protein
MSTKEAWSMMIDPSVSMDCSIHCFVLAWLIHPL